MNPDLFTPAPVAVAQAHADQFTEAFLDFLPENVHVYDAFEREAHRVVARGFKHYSSKTIIEVLRHHSALEQVGGGWKLNNNTTPYLARLFSLMNPANADLFEFRVAKAAGRTL